MTTSTIKTGTVTKSELMWAWLRWMFFQTSCWTWERMQNVAFAWHLLPILKRLYPKDDDLRAALKRHLVFFNSEPTLSLTISGTSIAMEEQRAAGDDNINDEVMNAVKTGMMGPLAAIGDSILASAINAVMLTIAMGLALQGNILGPIMFFIGWILIICLMSWYFINLGYRTGLNMAESGLFAGRQVEQLTEVMTVLGLVVIGALVASFIGLSTPISWTLEQQTTQLQTILDGILPKLIPLVFTGFLWYLHQFKNWSVMKLLGLTLILGTVGALLKIF
jgi:PTS system mannose-specific IID component